MAILIIESPIHMTLVSFQEAPISQPLAAKIWGMAARPEELPLDAAQGAVPSPGRRWAHAALATAVVAILLGLGIANIVVRARWRDVDDGVLWVPRTSGLVAAAIAPDSPAVEAGVRPGDLLISIDGSTV